MIDYITTESLEKTSGGWSGLNSRIFKQISKSLDLNYCHIQSPSQSLTHGLLSKSLRRIGLKGSYYMYSDYRLREYSDKVKKTTQVDSSKLFFGTLPWLNYTPLPPYWVITDICFEAYYNYYNKQEFRTRDIERLKEKETNFLKKAEKVFFTSQWALNECSNLYGINPEKFINIGIAGNIEGNYTPIESDTYFIYISQDFAKKGGNELFDAFYKLHLKHPQVTLIIIGGLPPERVLNHPGVKYLGFLNKSNPKEKAQYVALISKAMALVLPTKSDAAPLTIIECGYFGTPTIAPNRFAIPEMVIENLTGWILPSEYTVEDIYERMVYILSLSLEEINILRKKTFIHYNEFNTWEIVANRIIAALHTEQ